MSKKKKMGLGFLAFVVFYIFLYYSDSLFTVEMIVFSNKSNFSIGEEVTVYGFSIQPYNSRSGCDALIKSVMNSQSELLLVNEYYCTADTGKTLPLMLFSSSWDQKAVVEYGLPNKREQVSTGEYILIFMGKEIPIKIIS